MILCTALNQLAHKQHVVINTANLACYGAGGPQEQMEKKDLQIKLEITGEQKATVLP